MLTDQQFDELMQPILEIYNDMQSELLRSIARRLLTYDNVGGSLEWQIKKLDELGALNKESIQIISKYSKISEQQITKTLKEAGFIAKDEPTLIEMFEQGAFTKNPITIGLGDVVDRVAKETRKSFSIINSKALESTKEEYIRAVNMAYIEVGSGISDYNTSIKKAMVDVAKKGITGATYVRDDGTLVKYSIEGVVRRDVVTAINSTANRVNEKLAKELDATHYVTTQHLGARCKGVGHKNHESWQGIPTQIDGESDEYPNHKRLTGDGEVDGLGGVNCRHYKLPYFPGFSIIPPKLDKEENNRLYALLQKQRSLERAIRHWKRRRELAIETEDTKELNKSTKKVKQYQSELADLIKDNKELKRQSNREQIVN